MPADQPHHQRNDATGALPKPRRSGRIGPLTLRLNPELRLIRAQGIDPRRVSWIERFRVEYIIGVLVVMGTTLAWPFRVLWSSPGGKAMPVSSYITLGMAFFPILVVLLVARYSRSAGRSAMRNAGVRLCMDCGYDMSRDDMHTCPECGWTDKLRQPSGLR